jgi:hypothetical protein
MTPDDRDTNAQALIHDDSAQGLHLGAHERTMGSPIDSDSAAGGADPLGDLTSGLKVWADVGLSLGRSAEASHKTTKQLLAALNRRTPVDYQASASGVYPASGTLTLNLGGPDTGFFWEVKNVLVGGSDINVTAAGKAGLYKTGYTGATGINNAVDYASSLPNVGWYGTHQLTMNDAEYLYLVIFAGTPGQTYAASMLASVMPRSGAQGRDVYEL